MKKIFIASCLTLGIFLLSGCSQNQQHEGENIHTEDSTQYRVYTTQGDMQILPWRGRSQRVRNANIDEPKVIGLEKNLSYETSFGSQKYISLVYKTSLDTSKGEIQRFVREQNLTKIDTTLQNIFQDKIQKNKKELSLLGIDTKVLDNIIEDQHDLVIYNGDKIYKDNQYTIYLYYTKFWIMIDIYEKGPASKSGNNIGTQTGTIGDKTYKKVSLVPFAPATNGPDLSCEYMKLIDENGIEIAIPGEIRENTICEDIQIVSPNYRFVLYNYVKPTNKESEFVVYDIAQQKTYTIGNEFIGVDALKCEWNTDSTHIICAVVGQEGLAKVGDINTEDMPYISKFIIFELGENFGLDGNTKLLSKKEIFQKNSETIQFVCGDSCYIPDFIIGEKEIKYTGHEILAESKGFSIQYK